jgi:peptide/nickel transport system ATP-binding protein
MLARRPRLVLLDEPFAGLDRPTIRELADDLLEWHRELRFTMIAVDHRAEILERLCPRAAVIENGKIVQHGAWAELAAAPATPLLARLLAST